MRVCLSQKSSPMNRFRNNGCEGETLSTIVHLIKTTFSAPLAGSLRRSPPICEMHCPAQISVPVQQNFSLIRSAISKEVHSRQSDRQTGKRSKTGKQQAISVHYGDKKTEEKTHDYEKVEKSRKVHDYETNEMISITLSSIYQVGQKQREMYFYSKCVLIVLARLN